MRYFNETTQNLTSVNLERIFIEQDLLHWKEELAIAGVEMQFCHNLFASILKEEQLSHLTKYQNILSRLELLLKDNASFESGLLAVSNQFEGFLECQDLQCDNYYVSNHLDFKKRIERHFFLYRKLKKKLLLKVRVNNTHQ